jgi:hypothetical protein
VNLNFIHKDANWVDNITNWPSGTGTALGTGASIYKYGIQLGFNMPYFDNSYTTVSAFMDYGYSMGSDNDFNNRVVVAYNQKLSNRDYGNFVYNVMPSVADLIYLANITSYAMSKNGRFKFTPKNGFVLTWNSIEDRFNVQTTVITNGTYTFLILNYQYVNVSNLTAGYVYNGTEYQFYPTEFTTYYFQVSGPSLKSNVFF